MAKHTRNTDPETSFDAGEQVPRHTIRPRVYAAFCQRREFTDEELKWHYEAKHGPTPESSIRKRRCELTQDGLLRDSGRRRALSTGRLGIVWELVEAEPVLELFPQRNPAS
jgi:hypothetical protein